MKQSDQKGQLIDGGFRLRAILDGYTRFDPRKEMEIDRIFPPDKPKKAQKGKS